jgi:hypothetical protein
MNRRQPHRISDEIKWFIIGEKKAEVHHLNIKNQVFSKFRRRIAYETINRIWIKYLETGSVVDRQRSGRPKVFNEREERNIVRDFMNTPGLSIKQTIKERQGTERPASRRTVRRILRSHGLVPKVSEQGKEIVNKNKGKRVKFAREHLDWNIMDWSRIVFSDEATLYPMRTRTAVRWTRPGMANPPPQENNLRINSINVWAYITYDGTGRIFRFEGTMKKERYLKMLEDHLFVALEDPDDSDDEMTYMQDGASYHTAPLIKNWLDKNEVNYIDWPPQSPDLNPIENIWACVRNELWNRRAMIRNSNDTWRFTLEIFTSITLVYIRKLYNSMPKRLESVIQLKGNRTNY